MSIFSINTLVSLVRTASLLLFSTLVFFGFSLIAEQSTDKSLNLLDGKTHWFGLYVASHKVGYAYDSWDISVKDGKQVLVSTRFLSYNLVEFDTSYKETSVFKLDGNQTLISLDTIDNINFYNDDGKLLNTKKIITRVVKSENAYEINKNENGKQSLRKVDYFPVELKKYWFDIFALNEQFVKSLGGRKFVSGFDFDRGKPEYSNISNIKESKILSKGSPIIKKTIYAAVGLDSSEEVEIKLEYVGGKQTRFEALGNWVLIAQDKKDATAPGRTLKLKDIDFFPLEKQIDPDNVKELKLELRGVGVGQLVQNNARQKILSSNDDKVQILLVKNFTELKKKEKKLNLYLESTEALPLDLSELVAMNPIKNKNTSALKKAKTLNEFVYNYLEYSVRPEGPKLKEIILSRKGDCSEYALLLTALLRLNGIPAREVGGYAYTEENNSPSFGAHAWVEVYIDGRWKEFDPTWNEEKLGVEHILFNDGFLVDGSIEIIN